MSPKYCGFGEAVKLFFSNYVNFKSRSTRSEYWWVVLFNVIVSICISIVGATTGLSFISYLWTLATLLPGLGLSIRRMHDIGRSGWWILINLVPIAGFIIFLIFSVKPSDGSNAWGEPASTSESAE